MLRLRFGEPVRFKFLVGNTYVFILMQSEEVVKQKLTNRRTDEVNSFQNFRSIMEKHLHKFNFPSGHKMSYKKCLFVRLVLSHMST